MASGRGQLRRVGCFGKLPDKGDFFRAWQQQPAARSFDNWLQRGMHASRKQLGTGFRDAYARARMCRFQLNPASSGQTLTGVMACSRDKHGREYPLVCFAVSGPVRGGEASLHVVDSSTFFHVAQALLEEAARGLDAVALANALPGLEALTGRQDANRRAFAAFVEQTVFSAHWSPAMLQEAVALLSSARRTPPRRRPWGIKIPLGGVEADVELKVAFWTRLLVSIAASDTVQPAMFWASGSSGGADLWFFFQDPSPLVFRTLLDGRADGIDLVALGRGVYRGLPHLAPRLTQLLDPDLTLAAVLDLAYQIGREMRGRPWTAQSGPAR